jgi:hypothetical protein
MKSEKRMEGNERSRYDKRKKKEEQERLEIDEVGRKSRRELSKIHWTLKKGEIGVRGKQSP